MFDPNNYHQHDFYDDSLNYAPRLDRDLDTKGKKPDLGLLKT